MTDPDLREPEPISFRHQAPSQLWQPWTLVVPALLLLPMLSLAFAWQISPSDDADLRRPLYRYPRGEEVLAPEPTPEPAKPAPVATKAPPVKKLPRFTMFVPGDDAKLRAQTFPTIGGDGTPDFTEMGRNALNNLIATAPDYFPPGTKLQSLELAESDPSLALVSLSDEFWDGDFWIGETRADMAMQAIAHTLEAAYKQTGGKGALQIQLLRSKQPAEILGEFDVSEPYKAESDAVASKTTSAVATR